jgi:hypothetical protein
MIELERDESQDIEVWGDVEFMHVIVRETAETFPHSSPGPGFYVRDEAGERGPFDTLEQAFVAAEKAWGEVTLAPANRLRRDLDIGRADEIGDFLLEYLAEYGAVGIDPQALAQQVFARAEDDR